MYYVRKTIHTGDLFGIPVLPHWRRWIVRRWFGRLPFTWFAWPLEPLVQGQGHIFGYAGRDVQVGIWFSLHDVMNLALDTVSVKAGGDIKVGDFVRVENGMIYAIDPSERD